MIDFYENHLKSIEKGIADLTIPNEPNNLYEPIRYFLQLGGKRIRPLLALIGSELHDGDKNQALAVALSIELFHNFTLIHDDIMDKAPIRRGKSTVHEKWNENIAILSGDSMLIMAYNSLIKSNPQRLSELLKVFNETATKVCEGQQYDMDFETAKVVDIQQYIMMIEKKTSVLLGASLQMGAISANANQNQSQLLYEYGRHIGIAFQLQDDWLDVYGDPEKFGKKVGGDILARKKTYLFLKALQLANKGLKTELTELFSEHPAIEGDARIKRVVELYNELNAGEFLQNEMNAHYEKAMEISKELEGNKEVLSGLVKLSEQLMQRQL